ncbi:PAS domain S-box-containing protein [Neorhodopirellula lusitana]|uniref:histidine kinase n=1 Tax=Neorhodopirellula lusitana TaxID=445327 RepID=A0ABY1PQC2_9BACT|nr:CHASE domain-containing protein [Neorhodopirellula lusitana]SMP40932.1 PAS domain S-box-containing protein [Neorhodopirellula lusitana]
MKGLTQNGFETLEKARPSLFDRTRSLLHSRWAPLAVLYLGVFLTGVMWWTTHCHRDRLVGERFQFRVAQLQSHIESRISQYESVLRGGVALFQASRGVDRDEWHRYVNDCDIESWYPGIQAMGVTVLVEQDELADFEARVQADGFDDFKVFPKGVRSRYACVNFIEPFDWRNQRVFGYDAYSSPERRDMLNRAARTGMPKISGKITLVQEAEDDTQSGVLCCLPIYRNGAKIATESQRMEAVVGWVHAAFRCTDLMSGILDECANDVGLEIHDVDPDAGEQLLFASGNSVVEAPSRGSNAMIQSLPLRLSGRDWMLTVSAPYSFRTPAESMMGGIVGVSGCVISLLLFAVLTSLNGQRILAIGMAEEMTRELQHSEACTLSILENASESILSVDEHGRIAAANRASRRVFQAEDSLIGSQIEDYIVGVDLSELAKKATSQGGATMGMIQDCRREDGTLFPCSVSVGEVEVSGLLHYIVVARDETARIEAAQKLAEQHKVLVEVSHRAGRAEVATGVLHNVGNVLNSVNVSANLLREYLDESPVDMLAKAAQVINEQEDRLGDFFSNDPRAKHFPRLLNQVVLKFEAERESQLGELHALTDNIGHIKEIVSMQQSFAVKSGLDEMIDPVEIFEDAIRMNDASLERHGVAIQRDFGSLPPIHTQRHEVIQILVNLIRNAQQSIDESSAGDRVIKLAIRPDGDWVCFEVRDCGMGIPQENLTKIFQHGFTTKCDGHGFGLHSCANAAQELGGELTVDSLGAGKGACFQVRLPLQISSRPATQNVSTKNESVTAGDSSGASGDDAEALVLTNVDPNGDC